MTREQPKVARCPNCGRAVILSVDASVWCLPCGRRMAPVTPRGTPFNNSRNRNRTEFIPRRPQASGTYVRPPKPCLPASRPRTAIRLAQALGVSGPHVTRPKGVQREGDSPAVSDCSLEATSMLHGRPPEPTCPFLALGQHGPGEGSVVAAKRRSDLCAEAVLRVDRHQVSPSLKLGPNDRDCGLCWWLPTSGPNEVRRGRRLQVCECCLVALVDDMSRVEPVLDLGPDSEFVAESDQDYRGEGYQSPTGFPPRADSHRNPPNPSVRTSSVSLLFHAAGRFS